MKLSRRQYYCRYFITMLVVSVLVIVSALTINSYFYHIELITRACVYALITVVMLMLSVVGLILVKYKSLKSFFKNYRLLLCVEENLKSIGAYVKREDKVFVELPRIRIRHNTIDITLKNLKIRDAIEKHLNSFSTALPEDYIVDDYYITQNNSTVVIKFEDLNAYQPEEYSLEDYVRIVKTLDKKTLYFDKKHTVNIDDYPHFLISGSSGSGKSYLANQLVMQGILKEWKVYILDMKRSYGLYKAFSEYYFEPEEILLSLGNIEKEMLARLKAMQPEFDKNPRIVAADAGYQPIMIVLEEFISLQSALDKKQKEELERVVKHISVLARQASIHLFVVMQSAGTENIQPTTRSNLTKVLLGNPQSNIMASTFGTGVDIPNLHGRMGKGEGLIQLDRITVIRVPKVTDIESFKDEVR